MLVSPLLLIGIFLIELACLFFVSQLVIKSLARIFYRMTGSTNHTITLLALLFMPGTILHELAHVLMAGVLMVPTGDIEFTPEIQGDRVKLGSAEIGKTDLIRRALIGVAPVIIGTAIIIGLSYSMFFIFTEPVWWSWIIVVYLIFVFSNSMFSSSKDLEGFIEAFSLVLSIIIALYLFKIFSLESLNIWLQPATPFLTRVCLLTATPIVIDLVIYGFVKLFVVYARR